MLDYTPAVKAGVWAPIHAIDSSLEFNEHSSYIFLILTSMVDSFSGRCGAGADKEVALLAVVSLVQTTAPLTGHAARVGPRPGEAGAVLDEDTVGLGQFLSHVVAELGAVGQAPAPTKSCRLRRCRPACVAMGSVVLTFRPVSLPRRMVRGWSRYSARRNSGR
jgi:hypothetical protein